ncbi:MAG TPA: PhzF family phenazine biosynthesis protein [Nocardioidaceae bacterium]|nr:PhzF family phenazine biosynthesis protein [Nocardioidaceae bacterium]
MLLGFDIVDVFTDRPFAGNQLAVVRGADELSTDQCLALAREFGYSETTFPSSTVIGGAEYSTRIFTPAGEIPFAGHPTLGTAWVLRSHGLLTTPRLIQVCGAGRIGVRFLEDADDLVELSAVPRDLSGPLDEDVASALLDDLGLSVSDLAGPVRVAGCGLSFVHVPVVRGAVERARVSTRPLAEYADRFAAEGVNLVHVRGDAPQLQVHARVFVPGLSVPEDAATGSAAAGLGVALVATGQLPDGGTYEISQGVEMGRPSALHGRVDVEDGVAALCHVGGRVEHIARGEIAVPAPAGPLS